MSEALREIVMDELMKSRAEGEARGKIEGIMETLKSLVRQGALTIQLAASQAGMSEKDFVAAMG